MTNDSIKIIMNFIKFGDLFMSRCPDEQRNIVRFLANDPDAKRFTERLYEKLGEVYNARTK